MMIKKNKDMWRIMFGTGLGLLVLFTSSGISTTSKADFISISILFFMIIFGVALGWDD